jgi:DNA-binding GntR family transcriptional regulator
LDNDQKDSLAERAYIRLREDIHRALLAPGAVVSERELALQYGMSKTPIREAITQICREGLLQRLPGRGYMVSPITIKEIQDLFDMRSILEVAAVERISGLPDPDLFTKLEQMSIISYVHGDPESYVVFLEANRNFHLALAKGTGNVKLVNALEVILIEMERLFHLGLRMKDSSEEMTKEHKELVKFLENGYKDSAIISTKEQIETSKNRIIEAIMKGDLKPIQAIG